MSPRSGTQENSSVLYRDNAEGVRPTSGEHLRSHSPIPDSDGVLPISDSSPQVPEGNVTNAEFCRSIHVIAQLFASQAERGVFGGFSFKATRVGQFMRMVPNFY